MCVEGMSDAWKEPRAPVGWMDVCDDRMEIHRGLLYEIPGLPVLYLLDKNHRVLLKIQPRQELKTFSAIDRLFKRVNPLH